MTGDGNETEWKEARDTLVSVDNNLHDLRKWGFSFITGLLTVDALFANIPDTWKLAALVGTFVLVAGLALVDRNYHVLEDAIAQRATIIEAKTSFALTYDIKWMYDKTHVWIYYAIVYGIFDFATFVIGILVVKPFNLSLHHWIVSSTVLLSLMFVTAVFLLVLIYFISHRPPWVDIGTDAHSYTGKEAQILVTLTNLGPNWIKIKDVEWGIYRETDYKMQSPEYKVKWQPADQADSTKESPSGPEIGPGGNMRWLVPISDFKSETKSGLYRIVYTGPIYIKKMALIGVTPKLRRYELKKKVELRSKRKREKQAKDWDEAAQIQVG